MTTINNEQLVEYALNLAKSAPPFKPIATYHPEGDCIEFFAAPAPFYAEHVDDLVTVYYSYDTKEIVGSLIKGVSSFCRKFPGFKIEIQDGPVKLEHIFQAQLWTSDPESVKTVTYTKLIAMAEENEATAELAGVE